MRRLVGSFVLGLVLLGCGSEQSRMDRGVAVDREEAAPSSEAELEETEAEREKEERELER